MHFGKRFSREHVERGDPSLVIIAHAISALSACFLSVLDIVSMSVHATTGYIRIFPQIPVRAEPRMSLLRAAIFVVVVSWITAARDNIWIFRQVPITIKCGTASFFHSVIDIVVVGRNVSLRHIWILLQVPYRIKEVWNCGRRRLLAKYF